MGLVYFAFDLIHLEGERIDRLPLDARKARLQSLLGASKTGRLRYTEHLEGRGPDVFDQACRMGLEGIISKRRDLPYQPGRRDGWKKIKCLRRGLFVIGGFTDQQGSKEGLGALLVGRYEARRLIYNGRVGTGFTHALALDLRERLESIEQRACPFDPPPPGPLGRTATLGDPGPRVRSDVHRGDGRRHAQGAVVPRTPARRQAEGRRQRHLKIFSAIANGTTVHAVMIASSFQRLVRVAPSSTTPRMASTSAVSGSAWMNG